VAGGRRSRRRVCILISADVTLVCFITSTHVKKQTQLEAMQLRSGATARTRNKTAFCNNEVVGSKMNFYLYTRTEKNPLYLERENSI